MHLVDDSFRLSSRRLYQQNAKGESASFLYVLQSMRFAAIGFVECKADLTVSSSMVFCEELLQKPFLLSSFHSQCCHKRIAEIQQFRILKKRVNLCEKRHDTNDCSYPCVLIPYFFVPLFSDAGRRKNDRRGKLSSGRKCFSNT